VVLPVALVFSTFLIVRGSIGEAGAVPPVPQHRVTAPQKSPDATPSEDRTGNDAGDAQEDRGKRSPGSDDDEGESRDDGSPNSGPGNGEDSGDDSGHSGRDGGGFDDHGDD